MSDGVMLQRWIRDMRLNRTVICHSDENCALDEEDVFQETKFGTQSQKCGGGGVKITR